MSSITKVRPLLSFMCQEPAGWLVSSFALRASMAIEVRMRRSAVVKYVES